MTVTINASPKSRKPTRSTYTVVTSCSPPLPPTPTAHKVYARVRIGLSAPQMLTRTVLEIPEHNFAYLLEKLVCPAKDRCKLWLARVLTRGQDGVWEESGSAGSTVVVKESDAQFVRQYGRAWGEDPIAEAAALLYMRDAGASHKNVVRVHGVFQDGDPSRDVLYIVLPYLQGEDLYYLVRRNQKGLTEAKTRGLIRQMAQALLHMKNTYRLRHGDVSLENFILDHRGAITLIDFGMTEYVPAPSACCSGVDAAGSLACEADTVLIESQPRRGKGQYLSPETVLELDMLPHAPDCWSLGVVMYMLLTGVPVYQAPHDVYYTAIKEGRFAEVMAKREASGYTRVLSREAKDVILGLLEWDMHSRMTLEDLLDSAWMRGAQRGEEGKALYHVKQGNKRTRRVNNGDVGTRCVVQKGMVGDGEGNPHMWEEEEEEN